MTTVVSTQAGAKKVPNSVGQAGALKTVVGSIPNVGASASTAPVTTGPLVGDVYTMVKLPAGAVVVGGRVRGSRLSSGTSFGSSALAFNAGFSGAVKTLDGTSYGSTSSSNALGVISPSYAEVSGAVYDSGLDYQLGGLLYTSGPILLTEDQFAQLKVTVSAVSFVSAGALSMEVQYYMATFS